MSYISILIDTDQNILFISTKPLPDNSFCLNECRFGGKFD